MFRTRILSALALTASFTMPSYAADNGLPSHKYLPIALANDAAMTALATCTKQGYNVTVIVDDRYGDIRLMLVGDGVRNLNDVTKRKAYTAVKRATSSGEAGSKLMPRWKLPSPTWPSRMVGRPEAATSASVASMQSARREIGTHTSVENTRHAGRRLSAEK